MVKHILVAFERSFRFVAFLWWIYLIDLLLIYVFGVQCSLIQFGLASRTAWGLLGIFTMPFLHANLLHILSNSISLLCVLFPLHLEFSDRFKMSEVILKITIVSGILLWICGRGGAIHIGASALVYGLIIYAGAAGIIHKRFSLIAFGIAAVLFNGGSFMIGLMPIDPTISWEGHAMGVIAGLIVAASEKNERC